LVQIAARVVEVALHKLLHLGYDVSQVESASGVCALVPLVRGDIGNGVRDDVCDGTRDDRLAMGLANDAIAAAGQCQLTLRDRDREIDSVLGRVPWSSSPSFGTPFRRHRPADVQSSPNSRYKRCDRRCAAGRRAITRHAANVFQEVL
jgi:methenyltetrahydromethanopterin cyclohydrolase